MIQITPQMRVLVAIEPADFRKGIDGLARICKDLLQQDPFGGCVFVFRNRPANAIKALVYDGQGFWLCHACLADASGGGRHRRPPKRQRHWQRISCRCCLPRGIRRTRRAHSRGAPSVHGAEKSQKIGKSSCVPIGRLLRCRP